MVRGYQAAAAAVAVALAVPAHGFKIDWTGAGDGVSAYDEANWLSAISSQPPAAGTVDPGAPIDLIVAVSDLGLAIPTPIDASAGPLTLGPGGLLQVSGAVFNSTDSIRRDTTPGVDDSANVAMIIGSSTFNTARVTASSLIEIDVSLINQLTLTEGGDPLAFSTVGFSNSDSGAELVLAGESAADVVAEHLAKFNVAGEPAVVGNDPALIEPGDNLLILSDGAAGSIVTPITNPIPFLPGDADNDGDIDDTDLGLAISNFTGPVGSAGGKTRALGDTDGDGDVDDTDLGVMISGFTGPLAPASVPEPGSAALFILGAMTLSRRVRR